MRSNALKALLRLRQIDRDAAQRHFVDALALEEAAITVRAQAERTIADELRFAAQTDPDPILYEALAAWLPSGRIRLEGERLRETTAVATTYTRREHLIGQQVGLAAVTTIESIRQNAIRERAQKAEQAMLQDASLRRV